MLVHDDEHQVDADERDEQSRHDHDVQGVQARHDVDARELASEEEERDVGSHQRQRLQDAVDDSQTVAGEQVIGEGVAGEAGSHAHDDEQNTDDPVELTRATERTGEEHTQHVDAQGSDEEQSAPVVHLSNEQTAADFQRDRQSRVVGFGDLDAAQRQPRSVIVQLAHGGLEEEREERSRQDDDDEAVESNLAEHERPMRREDLATELAHEDGCPDAGFGEVRRLPDGGGWLCSTHGWLISQNVGPTGSGKSDWATR